MRSTFVERVLVQLAIFTLWAVETSVAVGMSTDCLQTGPDVVVRDLFESHSFGSVGDIAAFSVGTDACNIGDAVLDWDGDTPNHPVIDMALYRVHDGRLDQIGLAWLKHGFGAAQEDTCGCGCVPGDWEHLGVGCSDAYNATTNGMQTISGSRLEVDPWTGQFVFPPTGFGESGDTVFRRLQVAHADLNPLQYPDAQYLAEVHFVTPQDAEANNQRNNYSSRLVSFEQVAGSWAMALEDETRVGMSAIEMWKWLDDEVNVVTWEHPGKGRLLVGVLVEPLESGWYRYVWAVQNLDFGPGVQALHLPFSPVASFEEVRFNDVHYHSGDLVDETDWELVQDDEGLHWATVSWDTDPLANALRWGTTWTFSLIANVEPVDGVMTLEAFAPDGDAFIVIPMPVPRWADIDPCALPIGSCPADLDATGTVELSDLLVILETWGECGDGTWQPAGDVNQDCCVDTEDLLGLLGAWGHDCRPRGACCMQFGGCEEATLQEDCTQSGGIWSGEDVSCSDAACPGPAPCCLGDGSCIEDLMPDACIGLGGLSLDGSTCLDCPMMVDNCEDAIAIGAGVHAFDTRLATTDGPVHPECKTSDGGVTGNDIWMRFMPPSNGIVTLSTCNTADFDTDIVVYEGDSCDDFQLLACNDDTEGCAGWTSYLEVAVKAGETITIRLGGWQEGSVGTGEFLVAFVGDGACCLSGSVCLDGLSAMQCAVQGGVWLGVDSLCVGLSCAASEDDCADAAIIETGLHVFDTREATTDGPVHPECDRFDGGVTGNDIWFLFEPELDGWLVLSTCSMADFDTDLVVYDGVNCDALQLLGCNDDTDGCVGWTSYLEVPVTEGNPYLIRVGGWQETHVGTGILSLDLLDRH